MHPARKYMYTFDHGWARTELCASLTVHPWNATKENRELDLVTEAQPPKKQLEELQVQDALFRRIFFPAQSTPQEERLPAKHNWMQGSAQDTKGARSDKSSELLRLPYQRFWCQTQKQKSMMRLTRS
jgi:hypothetical protein